MEGFHLFQEKIKGEVKTIKQSDPQVVFVQPESLSGWDLSEFHSHPLAQGELKYLQPFDMEEESTEYELAPFVNCSIEYSTLHHKLELQIEDERDLFFNFNNDLVIDGQHTIMLFYD